MRRWSIGIGLLLVAGAVAILVAFWPRGSAPASQPAAQQVSDGAPRFAFSGFDPAALRELQEIEARVGGRLGVMLVSPDDHLILANRETERFPICSTFKLPLAVMILSDVDAGTLRLDRALPFGDRRVVPNSPTIEMLKQDDATEINVEDALAAMMTQSDNTAANLLLTLVGDNSGYSRRIEAAFGNDSIRMDRSEGVLNEDAARREDTATPDAMVAVLARVFHGNTLSRQSTQRLSNLMHDARTGSNRVRAGLPQWLFVGDKTGTCTRTYNSVGYIDVGRAEKPFLYAVYLDETDASEQQAESALADVGRLFGRLIETQFRDPREPPSGPTHG